MGVPIELDENWRPTAPPKDLSAYKACLFPETAREKYDADLNAFHRAGGYLAYFKYYPVMTGTGVSGVHHYFESYGRDAYFFHSANTILEAGLTVRDRDFLQTLERRSIDSMIVECRADFFSRYGARQIDQWRNWGDPAYTQLLSHRVLAEKLGDAEWLDLVKYCLTKLSEAADAALTGEFSETGALVNTADIDLPMMGALLMDCGARMNQPAFTRSGLKLVRYFVDHNTRVAGIVSPGYMRYLWRESVLPLPALHWAHLLTGEKRFLRLADTMIRGVAGRNHCSNGLWRHWSDPRGKGKKGACWSRGTYWPVLFMTESLKALEPGSGSAASHPTLHVARAGQRASLDFCRNGTALRRQARCLSYFDF